MEKDRREVYGSYENPEEAISVIRKLQEEGYTRDQITVYSNARDDRSYDKMDKNQEEVRDERSFDKVDSNITDKDEEGSFDTVDKNSEERSEHGSFDIVDEDSGHIDSDRKVKDDGDESLWEQIKDFFTPDTYDYDKESQKPNYRKEHDVLYPHREDLLRGNRVIVLDKPNEEQNRINI